MTRIASSLAAALVLSGLAATAARAADEQPQIETVAPQRFGFGNYADRMEARMGVLAYDRGAFSHDQYSGVVINGEFLFRSPEFLSALGAPRPYVGFDLAIADDPVHFVYAGLNWDYNLTHRLYLSGSAGGAITTAEDLEGAVGYKSLGSRVLFHLGVAVGFDITDDLTVQAYADHFSNANLADENEGAEATGVRLGYRF